MNLRDQAKRDKKDQIRAFADHFISEYHRSPSTQEIATALGINKSTAWRYLVEMNDDQELQYDGKTILAIPNAKTATEMVLVPVSGVIPCGTPQEEEEATEQYFQLPRELLGPGEFFLLRASGDSMVDVGIESDDLVIVRRALEASPGDIIAAIIDQESTLKTLRKDPDNRLYLHPENAEKGYPDIRPESFSIQGVAVKVIKKL